MGGRQRALGSAATGRRGTLLAAGPDLPAAPAEVEALATLYRRPTVLLGGAATADAALQALGRSRLAHLACHGSYRADNPLFSTLALADGPLTVYDLERCRTMPRTVVLSACSVATSSVLRGGTLLGLASALMTFGASTIIAPLTPVSDERVVPVMVAVHQAMVGGAAPAAALARTVVGRRWARPDRGGVPGDRRLTRTSDRAVNFRYQADPSACSCSREHRAGARRPAYALRQWRPRSC